MRPEPSPPGDDLLLSKQARRRSWPQRLLLSTGVMVTVFALSAAAIVGWGAWKLRSIDRTEVSLDQAAGGPSNYLIVGSDSRSGGDPLDPEAGDDHAPLADTIMLLRIDPSTKAAKMLSLPRDLWVTLPTTGQPGRINAAYSEGPQELVDTLRNELDVPINHYVEVDFKGFQEIVTAVDGVPMWFDRAMRDRNTGLDVLHPGCIPLDGRSALAFARSRHLEYFSRGGFTYDGTGDLGRISRQQLFLRRVIDRARDKGISNPLTLKRLVDVGTANVTIDDELSVTELLALGQQFSSFESDALKTYTLPNTPRTTSGGAQIVELDRPAAEPILDLFRDAPGASTSDGTASGGSATTSTSVATTVSPGDVDVMVLNSSGRTGEAVDAADALVAVGFEVGHFGNGDELEHPSEEHTVVRYAAGMGEQAETVAASVKGSAEVVEDASLDKGSVVLFLGSDYDGISEATGSSSTASGAGTSTGSTSNTSTPGAAVPAQSEVVGMIPGDPPPGKSCG